VNVTAHLLDAAFDLPGSFSLYRPSAVFFSQTIADRASFDQERCHIAVH
jgi:hypothetical protein